MEDYALWKKGIRVIELLMPKDTRFLRLKSIDTCRLETRFT